MRSGDAILSVYRALGESLECNVHELKRTLTEGIFGQSFSRQSMRHEEIGHESFHCRISPATRAVHNHKSISSLATPPLSPISQPSPYAAIVTSTSTPASMLMIICLTTSVGAWRSMRPISRSLALISSHFNPDNPSIRTLVNAHLKGIPSLGALTARRLAGGDLEDLCGQADGALYAQVLVLGAVDELLADLFERFDVAGGQGDADLVDLGAFAEVFLGLVWCRWLDFAL